jgi:hypothetical protein
MGLFDVFKKKKQDDPAAMLAELSRLMTATNPTAGDADEIPGGTGPFGLCPTNPIPTGGIPGTYQYLARLVTKEGHPVENVRTGTTGADNISGMIDMYRITNGSVELGTIYVCPYHKRNSTKAPAGFRLL